MRRESQGKMGFQPLVFSFQMVELRASYVQKYDAVQAEYLPDRTLTPCVLTPKLSVVDEDGIATGDKTTEIVNVTWTVNGRFNGVNWVNGTDYVIDPTTHQLTIQANMDPGYMGKVSFYGEYLDERRGEVHKFRWERTMTCETYADYNVQIRMEQSKISLSPWKNRGTFGITAQLYNSDAPAPDADCSYQWFVWDNNVFRPVGMYYPDLWCDGGANTKTIRVKQAYIQNILLCCQAYLRDAPDKVRSATVRVRRWYGQYDDDLVWLSGKYIFPDTTNAEAEVQVTRRNGIIANPLQYFDIEILYNNGSGDWWQHVCHENRGMVPRSMFPVDSTMQHRFGWILREKSALLPMLNGNKYFTINGRVAVGQFPTTPREE